MKKFIWAILIIASIILTISIFRKREAKVAEAKEDHPVLIDTTFPGDSGPAQSVLHESVLHRIGYMQTSRSEQITGSRWGVCGHWIADEHPLSLSIDQRLELLSKIGAKWVFLCPDWDCIEYQKKKYDWNSSRHRFDDVVNGLIKRRITPVIQIYGGNHLYMPLGPDCNNRQMADAATLLDNPEVNKAWSRYVEALVKRYKARVKTWEIWNEPNGPYFWKKEPTAGEYGRVVKAAAKIIKEIQPDAIIVAGSTALPDYKYLNTYLDGEGADSFDYWSIHPYGAVPEASDSIINRMQQLLRTHGKSSAIWQSECGFPSNANTGGWGYGGPCDETKHAKWVLRRLLCDASNGMPVSIYFVLYDYPSLLEGSPTPEKMGINRKGLYHYGSWEPKPAAYAFSNLSSLIDDRYRFITDSLSAWFNVSINDPSQVSKRELIRKCVAKDTSGGQLLYLYWLGVPMEKRFQTVRVNITLTKAITDPVLVDLLDGSVYELPVAFTQPGQIILKNLPMADSPVVICSRDLIKLNSE